MLTSPVISSPTPIQVAVVGAGHWGPNLIRNFENPPVSRMRVVVDRDPERLGQVKSRFPHVDTTDSLERVLGDPEIDAVVVATPTSTHFAIAKAALQAEKHVLVEKPITQRSSEAAELIALAHEKQRVLMVGHVFIFNQAVRQVAQYIESGDLGRIYYVSMVRTNLGPIRRDVSASWDLMSHDISIVNDWLKSPALAASAVGGNWINPGIRDAVFATLRYPDNVLVNVHASWLSPRKAREITVTGDKRMLTFDDMDLLEPVRIYDKRVTETTTRPGYVDTFASFRASVRDGDITIPKVPGGEPLKTECEHFLECIREGRPPLVGGQEAMAVVRVLEAIDRSMNAGGREEAIAS